MEINVPFKFRVQINAGKNAEGFTIIKRRLCFLAKERAERYFETLKKEVLPGEILLLEDRKTKNFKELRRYEAS